MALFDNLQSELKLSASDYIKEAKKAERASDDVADATDKMGDSAEGSASGANRAKQAVGGLGAAAAGLAAGGLAKSVSAATDFQTSMADVQKVTSKGVANKLKGNFQDLAEEIPISQGELATLGEQAGKFGVKGSKNITKFVKSVGQISSATDLTAEEAGTRFAKIAGAIDLPMGKISKLGNATNSLADSMKTDAGEITDTANRAGITLSKRLGLSKRSVLALSASMNEVSPSAQLAASGLKQAAEALMDPKKVGKIASALGMNTSAFRKLRKQNPQKLFDLVSKAMANGGQKATKLAQAVGKRPTRAFSQLGNQVGKTHKAMKTVGGQFKNGTSLAREMSIRTGTAAGKWQLFKNKLQNVAITTGDVLLPVLLKVLDPISSAVSAFGSFNEKLDGLPSVIGLVGTAVSGLVVAVGMLGPSILEGLGLIGGLAPEGLAAGAAMETLGSALAALTGPIGLAVAAVAAFGVAYHKNLFGVRDTTNSAISRVRSVFAGFAGWLRSIWKGVLPVVHEQIAGIGDLFKYQSGIVGQAAKETAGVLRSTFGPAFDSAASSATGFASKVKTALTTGLRGTLSVAGTIVRGQMTAIGRAMTAGLALMRGDWRTAWRDLTRVVNAELDVVQGILQTLPLPQWLKGPLQGALEYVNNGFYRLSMNVRSAFESALGRINFSGIRSRVQTTLNGVSSWLRSTGAQKTKTAFAALSSRGKSGFNVSKADLLPKVRRGVTQTLSWVRTAGPQKARSAFTTLSQKAKAAFSFGKTDLLPKLRRGVNGALSWVQTTGAAKAATAFRRLGSQALGVIRAKFGPQATKVVRQSWNRVTGAIRAAIQPIIGPIQKLGRKFGFLNKKGRLTARGLAKIGLSITALMGGPVTAAIATLAKLGLAWNSNLFGVRSKITAALAAVRRGFTKTKTAITGAMASVKRTVGPTVRQVSSTLRRSWSRIAPEARRTWNAWKRTITGVVRAVQRVVVPSVRRVTGAVRKSWSVLGPITRKAWNALKTVVLVTAGALVLPVVRATQAIKRAVTVAFRALAPIAKPALNAVKGALTTAFRVMRGVTDRVWDAIKSIIGTAIDGAVTAVVAGLRLLRGDWKGALTEIKSFGERTWSGIKRFVGQTMSGMAQQLGRIWNGIKTTARNTWNALKTRVVQAATSLKTRTVAAANSLKTQFFNAIVRLSNNVVRGFNSLKQRAVSAVGGMLSQILSKARSWVGQFTKPFRDAADRVKGLFAGLKRTVVGNSTVPDMLTELVGAASGSWAGRFVKPFESAASAVEKRLSKLRDRAGRIAGEVGGKAKGAVKSVGKAVSGGGSNVRKRAEWAGERYKTVRKGRLAGIPKPLAKQMRDVYKNQVKGKRSWASYVKRARNYGENARGKKGVWYEDTAVAKMATGGTVLSDGLIYAHKGEDVVPAKTSQPYSGGSGGPMAKEVHHHHESTILKLDADEVAKLLRGEAVDVYDERERQQTLRANAGTANQADMT